MDANEEDTNDSSSGAANDSSSRAAVAWYGTKKKMVAWGREGRGEEDRVIPGPESRYKALHASTEKLNWLQLYARLDELFGIRCQSKKVVPSTVGTMDWGPGKNRAEPTYKCGLKFFRNPFELTTQGLGPQYGKLETSNFFLIRGYLLKINLSKRIKKQCDRKTPSSQLSSSPDA